MINKPKALMCYICGREYLNLTLDMGPRVWVYTFHNAYKNSKMNKRNCPKKKGKKHRNRPKNFRNSLSKPNKIT